MSVSQEGPHKGQIYLRGGRPFAAEKRWGTWYAGGESAHELHLLERKLERKYGRKSMTRRASNYAWRWAGR